MSDNMKPGLIVRTLLKGAKKLPSSIQTHEFDMILGAEALEDGVDEVTIAIGQVMDGDTYNVYPQLSNVVDSPPSMYTYMVTSKLHNMFTVTFSEPIDSENYILEWMVFE